MVQSAPKLLTVDEFITQYGDNERYELIDGELIEMEPTGPHEQVAAFIGRKLNVIVLDRTQLVNEPLWQQEPVITLKASIKLVVEVVSTDWQNDYARKVEDYALFGVPEYWIVDYLGIGGREYIGKPKQPTITICTLIKDEYQKQLFRGDDLLVSSIFSDLQLTAKQIFAAAQVT